MPPAPGFRFNAATIFLTYPQCNLTREALLEQLQALFEIKDYVIAQETHQDGSPHLHAFLKFERKINKRTADFADVLGFHPNITAPRSIKAVITYVEKDGNYIASDGIKDLLKKKTYGSLVKEATSKGEFMSMVLEHFPRDAVLNHERLLTFADHHFRETAPVYQSPFDADDFPNALYEMNEWVRETLSLPRPNPLVHRPKGLLLVGASRLGKTAWARSLGLHMYHAGNFNLDNWAWDVSYALFDDIPWEYFPSKKQLLGAQWEFNLTDKYRRKKSVKYGLPWIYSMNEDNWHKIEIDPIYNWLLQNSIMIRVEIPLFDE